MKLIGKTLAFASLAITAFLVIFQIVFGYIFITPYDSGISEREVMAFLDGKQVCTLSGPHTIVHAADLDFVFRWLYTNSGLPNNLQHQTSHPLPTLRVEH